MPPTLSGLNFSLANIAMDELPHRLLNAGAFGVLGIVLLILGFKLFDWILPKVDVERELAEKHNVAVAIVMASVILGVSAVIIVAIL